MQKLFFTGQVAAAPVSSNFGETDLTKFTLISNEYAGKDTGTGEARERAVSVRFTAFAHLAKAIAKHVMEGDQLIVEARLENNNFTDEKGTQHYGYNFTVLEFAFGAPGKAKREQLANRQ